MKLRLLGPAVAAVALVGTTLTAGVAAADAPSAAPLAAAAAKKPDCTRGLTNVPAKETVKLRTHPKLNATAVGQWNKKKKGFVCHDGKSFKGQKYTLCGKTSTEWLYGIPYGSNRQGYVPRACIDW
ncbi:hypothetical protein AB0B50_36280 [Streptomyces sp. NPDC041068]|uniref:hypothetical protein n=1 Tax=Streptomyces sp. NPDC041068 TaxID=3155130 RepID=UPI0033FA53AA